MDSKTRFTVSIKKKDTLILESFKSYFGGIGTISSQDKDSVQYRVASLKEIRDIIIPHFDKYPPATQKLADFILFKQVLDLIKEKDNLSIEGISKIINIKASMNLGISETQKSNFSLTLWADAVVKKAEVLINPVVRPVIITNNIFDPNWISGFTSAEGSFDVSFRKSLNPKVKKYVTLRFRIYQHERDRNLMELLIKYLGSGKIEKHSKNPVVNLTIGKFSDINNIIIPFYRVWRRKISIKWNKTIRIY